MPHKPCSSARLLWRAASRNWVAYVFLLPAVVPLLFVLVLPSLEVLRLSFVDVNLRRPGPVHFVGLAQYRQLLADPVFGRAFVQSWEWALGSTAGQFGLGLAAALLLNQRLPARSLVRGLVLLPWVLPGTLVASVFGLMFTSVGLVNSVLHALGLMTGWHPWLSDPRTTMLVLVAANTWKGFPFFAVVLLAALQSVSPELIECARIDGAGALQTFRHITLPGIRHAILISALLATVWTFNSVDLIYNLTYGGPYYASFTLVMFAFVAAFSYGWTSAAAAAGVIAGIIAASFAAAFVAAQWQQMTQTTT